MLAAYYTTGPVDDALFIIALAALVYYFIFVR